jgi:hypothetical protein
MKSVGRVSLNREGDIHVITQHWIQKSSISIIKNNKNIIAENIPKIQRVQKKNSSLSCMIQRGAPKSSEPNTQNPASDSHVWGGVSGNTAYFIFVFAIPERGG